ncbi:MAG: polyribonucleotide nucleotidyltransferase [Dehalococcoidia bacterium]|nr:polyribonucleotide nucleotidyltransferase [Dehalococcoidia bacterium]
MIQTFSRNIGGRLLSIEVGRFAEQAGGAALVRYGDTVVLATVCVAPPREGLDFFPLTVEYEERHYAVGKIPGSFFRREGRPTQEATLAARLTDRCLRPLFPKGFRNEVQVIVTVLSADQENPPEVLSILGASVALGMSEIPFDGPVAATRLGYVNNELVVNPTFAQVQDGSLDLVVAGTGDAVIMVEAGAKEVPERVLLEALELGQKVNQELLGLQAEAVRGMSKPKMAFKALALPAELQTRLASLVQDRVQALFDQGAAKGERNVAIEQLQHEAIQHFAVAHEAGQVKDAFETLLKKVMRSNILKKGIRPDGRGVEEIRPISSEVGILPRTHGTGLFRRGQTQVLTIASLGSLGEAQKLDTLSPENRKRFIHHYNFPPYSSGEVRRMGTGRREIGHGALAERALEPVIPGEDEFPYTIRLVSEVLSSNGSTSMASVCGSTLALMDAGVPIKSPVAGVAMGVIMDEETGRYAILTDIQGIEDAQGDMDFKVAGTADGVTALQMDTKIKGLSLRMLDEALAQALRGRLFILDKMRDTISQSRTALSPYAPRILKMTVPVDKIGAIIGPGGRTIRAIIQQYKVTIDVESDGTVIVGSPNMETAERAMNAIKGLVKEAEVGEVYTGKVTRIMDFGAFVEILPGKEGLVHISELADHRVERVEDEVKLGDEVTVMVKEIDRLGRINLSRRDALAGQASAEDGGSAPRPGADGGRREAGPRPPQQGGNSQGQRPDSGGRGPRLGFPPRRPGS